MIVYDKEQKEIVIPNGIGNINLFNNGVEAGYNEGYEQGQSDMAGKARVLNVTENGNYLSRFSDPIIPTVTGVYADGTEFYNYAELDGKVFNTKIAATTDSRLEFWFKGKNTTTENRRDVIIGSNGIIRIEIEYFESNDRITIYFGTVSVSINWENEIWHHFIISKAEGFWLDGKKLRNIPSNATIEGGGMFIINASFNYNRNSNGTFGMIKIDDTIIIPTADGFLNTNTGKLLEVEKDGGYTFTENAIIYGEGELYKTINVNVPDLNGSYDEGYAQGKTDGINEQKSKLESINITENGTYRKEDGYNEVVVNVADLNGSYDEGYEQGQADVAANARVLEVTENGNYLSKFSDPIIPANVTGRYADGTEFYSYANLTNIVYNTGIKVSENTKIEIWYKPRDLGFVSYGGIIGPIEDTSDNAFNIHTYIGDGFNNSPIGDVFNGRIKFYNSYYKPNDLNKWFHLELSFADGFIIDGVVVGTYTTNTSNYGRDIYINKYTETADGYYGMIKIDDTIIIPTEEGFLNTSTSELLEVVQNGSYIYTNNEIIQGEGELYKTINVNVLPKINVQKTGLRLGYSKFTEVPEWVDFEGINDMSNMFSNCSNLQTIPEIDTSNVKNMEQMFRYCYKLQTIPLLDTSNVTNMYAMLSYCSELQTIPEIDTSNVTNMEQMFGNSGNLQTIPPLNTSKVTNMYNMFGSCWGLTSLPALNAQSLNMPSYQGVFGYSELSNLTDFGGFLNLKCSLTNDSNLKRLPNLTYESCINVLNGLYDFTGNGETPNSNQGKLKVHQNFLDKVGEEISIATNKGWTITA